MKKYSLFLFISFLFLKTGSAQNFSDKKSPTNIEWSAGETGSSRFWYSKVLGQSDEGTFLLRSNLSLENNDEPTGFRTRKFALTFYDNLFSYKWEKQIIPPNKEGKIEKIFFAMDKVVMLYSLATKGNDAIQLWAQLMDKGGLSQTAPMLILELKDIRKFAPVNFNYAFSPDHEILGISATYFKKTNDTNPKNSTTISISLLNGSFSSFFKKEFTLPMNENEFSADNFFVGADSSFFFAGQARGNTSNGFIVYKYDAQSAQTLLSRIEAPKKYISEYIISFDDKNKKIIVSGFYSEQNNSSAAGVFFVSANAQDLTNSASSAHAFDDSFLSYFIGEPKTADKKELLNYRANQLVLKNDGGALLIAEARYTTTYTYFDFFTKTYVTRTMFHFDNILVFSINKDGSLDWQKSIAKKQESQEDDGYYSSYTHLVFGDNLYFLFNSFEGKLTSVILQSVTGKGEEKRSVITENSEDVALIPRAGRQIDSGVAVIPAFRKNKYLLAKISF